ncbi:hypothetical protein HID58_006974 [Brassica napus]|uniref:DUF223 domain-containing protein n=1 Tax=Brassica napus TaxID=3708 RepID=A0ABQ8EDK8_BRANA|nr:hypothetical protein HID58_006974 [Brassica napus]
MEHILQKIHQLQEGISVRPITVCIKSVWNIRKHQTDNTQICIVFLCYDHYGQLLEGRLTGNIQPNDSKNLTEGDIYEFSGFSVIHNSRHRKLTNLPQQSDISKSQFISSKIQKSTAVSLYTHILTRFVGQIVIIKKIKPYHPELNIDATIGLRVNRSTIVKFILCDKQTEDFSILQSKKDRKFRVVIITSIIPKLFQDLNFCYQHNNNIQYFPYKLLLCSSPATNFYFNKSIDYINHFKRQIKDPAKPCSKE